MSTRVVLPHRLHWLAQLGLLATLGLGGFVALSLRSSDSALSTPQSTANEQGGSDGAVERSSLALPTVSTPSLPSKPPRSVARSEPEIRNPESGPLASPSLHPDQQVIKVAAVLRAAAERGSEHAVYEAIRFCDEDPSYSFEYGQALIALLGGKGEYSAALRFIVAEDAEGWLGENGSKWMTSLFTAWAHQAPQQAIEMVEVRVPPAHRAEAFQVVASIWARKDPISLAGFIGRVPAASEKRRLLETTLLNWTER